MTEDAKIKIAEVVNNVPDADNVEIEKEWLNVKIKIKPSLSMLGVLAFTDYVINICFLGESMTYTPETLDYAIRSATVELYSNVELPEDVAEKYDYVCRTDLPDVIIEAINQRQYGELLGAIEKKVDNIAQKNISAFAIKTNETMEKLGGMTDIVSSVVEGMDDTTLAELVSNLSKINIDEGKLAKAVVEKRFETNE